MVPGGVGCRDILNFKDILKHRGTREHGDREEIERGSREGIYCKGWEVGLGSLVEARVSAQSPVFFVFGRLARS